MHHATAIVDLGFGDAGKGTMVDAIAAARGAGLVVRFNGGAQAGHNVVTPDGRHHTFSQLGAASFLDGVLTLLGPRVALHPLALVEEEAHLRAVGVRDALDRLRVDGRALVTTPYHQAANRLRELLRGDARHGSCGVGHGETVADALDGQALLARDLDDPRRVRRALAASRDAKRACFAPHRAAIAALPEAAEALALLDDPGVIDEVVEAFCALRRRFAVLDPEQTAALIADTRCVVFEGAQGVLIDEWYGFHPHTTWSTTTFTRAEELLDEVADLRGARVPLERLGVLRVFAVRHGAGPFVTESAPLGAALGEPHNDTNPWQGAFRHGHFDALAARYALDVCAPAGHLDGLALTHLDALERAPTWRAAERYRLRGPAPGPDALGMLRRDAAGDVTGLTRLPAPDLARQAALTELLERCEPVLSVAIDAPGRDGGARVVDAIAALLETEVRWTSAGLTRHDKVERAPARPLSPPRPGP